MQKIEKCEKGNNKLKHEMWKSVRKNGNYTQIDNISEEDTNLHKAKIKIKKITMRFSSKIKIYINKKSL